MQETAARERLLTSAGQREERLAKWVCFSFVLHGALIAGLVIAPFLPSRSRSSFPVYTVDLVGGEKLGGSNLGTEIAPPPKKEEKPKAAKIEPPPPKKILKEKEVKKEKKPPVEKTPPAEDKTVFKERAKEKLVKKEPEKTEAVKEAKPETKTKEGLPDSVREKLIQAALDRVRNRTEDSQQKEKPAALTAGPGQGEGAAALGPGGRGGGVVKGIDFLVYRNRMLYLIRERWAWVGKRSDLEVTVHFGIRDNGEIVGTKIVQASGDPSYDDSVLRALRGASPLPPPPENYRKDFMDVELTFRPKDLGG